MTDNLRILLVGDDKENFRTINDLLDEIPQSPFHLEWVSTPGKARQAIQEERHDIYLIDYRLGKKSGLEILSGFDLVQRPESFILLTDVGDENIERKAMYMGIADYLVKGRFDSESLSRVMRYSLQRKILEAQRVHQLIEINRSKDEFIALASHQLRTPATAVKQYVGMVLEGYAGEVSEEQRRFLQSAYESNERQIQVVNDILRVAKLDLKKISLKPDPADLGALVESILHDAASTFETRNQAIHYTKPPKPVFAMIDTEYMRMALGNIIDNASKYTTPGSSISVKVDIGPKGKASVIVRDKGVGIAEHDMDKLFKKFSRIDNPLSVRVGGTGLGLYWSNEVIELHGGSIEVDSELGVGTTFKVILNTAI